MPLRPSPSPARARAVATRTAALAVPMSHVRLRLESVHGALTPAGKRLCAYILSHPEELLHLTISELAQATGVSDATVTRLCQTLGYQGYADFRVLLARDLAALPQPPFGELKATDAAEDVRDKLIAGSVATLNETRLVLDADLLREAAERIAKARRVDVYGIGGSAAVALDIHHKLLRLGIVIAAHSDVDIMSISSGTLSSQDLAIGVSHTGRTEPVVGALQRAGAGGAATLALTHDPGSPLALSATLVLTYAAKPTAFSGDSLSGRIAQLVIADMLYAIIACAEFERSTQLIDQANWLANGRRL